MSKSLTQTTADFLKTITPNVSASQTYTTSRKMLKNPISHTVKTVKARVEKNKAYGKSVIEKLGLNV